MKIGLAVLLFLISVQSVTAQIDPASLLKQLDETITNADQYDQALLKKIQVSKKDFQTRPQSDTFFHILRLYEAYHLFNYDSAFACASQLLQIATDKHDPAQVAYAKLKLASVLLSAGLFKEVFGALHEIDFSQLSPKERAEYHSLWGRYYYDLGDYAKDVHFTPQYTSRGNQHMDSSLAYLPDTSVQYIYNSGLKYLKAGNDALATEYLQTLLRNPHLSLHDIAVTASTLSDIYVRRGATDSATLLLARSAIADIQSSTKETSAIFNLSSLLFKQGNFKKASVYIEKAVSDALSYGARQRKVQLSAMLPLIEAEKLNLVENEKRMISTYAVIVTISLFLLIGLTAVILMQVKKMKKARLALSRAHEEQQSINARLLEANAIKEEYIGYFFGGNTEFYNRIDRFKRSVEQKIHDRKWDEILFLVNNLNLTKEREELLQNFDRIFLKLFPNFIAEFNELFREEDRVKLKEQELLNTDLRIFALIRLGIHDTDKIARILQYSVNTINTYKTKIENKSIVPNEAFEQHIMAIKSL